MVNAGLTDRSTVPEPEKFTVKGPTRPPEVTSVAGVIDSVGAASEAAPTLASPMR